MQVYGFSEFRQNLSGALDYVAQNHAPVIIKRGKTTAVMISLDEYNAYRESEYLLANPANAKHLRQSIADHQAHKTTPRALIDD